MAAAANPQAMLAEAFRLHQSGQLKAAGAAYLKVIQADPNNVDALHLLGLVARAQGDHMTAEQMIRRALVVNPQFGDAHYNLGNTLKDLGRLEESIASYREALRIQPNNPTAHYNIGNALRGLNRTEEAIAAFRHALGIKPEYVEALHNLGTALQDQGTYAEALQVLRKAVQLSPDLAEAHYNLGLSLLAVGDLPTGFREYEWRWQVSDFPSPKRNFPQPRWNGEVLAGRTILLHAEQGMGDAIQFLRYVPMVAEQGGTVIVEVHRELAGVAATVPGVRHAIPSGDPLPHFDVHCPLMSLPTVFGTDLRSVPANIPYLRVTLDAVARWEKRLGPRRGLRVGLVWAGNPRHRNDRRRSLELARLAPLAAAPGTTFYSLQKGPAADQAAKAPGGMRLIELGPELNDMADTAAVLMGLDVLICVDTAVGHLAGALGRPTWMLLPKVTDWRWLTSGHTTPWYPTFRLFRQAEAGNWTPVVESMAKLLTTWGHNTIEHYRRHAAAKAAQAAQPAPAKPAKAPAPSRAR